MSNRIKAPFLGFLALCAVVLSVFAFAGTGRAEDEMIGNNAPGSENNYVLRDYEGYVAVFVENDPACPMTVTDIEVGTLRELDRVLLQTGMKVKTHERLMMILEDIGS